MCVKWPYIPDASRAQQGWMFILWRMGTGELLSGGHKAQAGRRLSEIVPGQ